MKAIPCEVDGCRVIGTPTTMFNAIVGGDAGQSYGDPDVAVYGAVCYDHALQLDDDAEAWWQRRAPMVGDTLYDADVEPRPSDDALDEWIGEEGASCNAFIAACEYAIEAMLDVPATTSVPYGSTMVELPDDLEVPEAALRAVAWEWFEKGRLTWSTALGPVMKDGHRHYWLVLDNDEKG